jgi:hypothetical protein
VIGFLLLAFYLPAADLLRRWAGRNRALVAAVLLLALDESAFFTIRVIPFYRAEPVAAGRRTP